jgi:1-acyl-sn-glycerol-3-phosphate acyltransferase
LGLYFKRGHHIAVDRSASVGAMRDLVRGGARVAESGRSIIIFPEGTRKAPGDSPAYLPGVLALYRRLNLPIVPVALNSGHYWGRHRFHKPPGTIIIEFLEPIEPGFDRRKLIGELQDRIETASQRLAAEAGFEATTTEENQAPTSQT